MRMRYRMACVLLAVMLGAGQALASPPPGDIPQAVVVMYHRFGENRYPSTNIRPEQVRDHLARLRQDQAVVLPLETIVGALESGTPLPDRATAITVDDGYGSVYQVGWPLLRAAGVPWTLFVNTETVGQSGYMTWAQLRELAVAGVTIGAHSHSHAHFPALTPEQQRADLLTMQAAFQKELGQQPRLFAYPYGEADGPSMALLREMGYRAAFGQQSGVVATSENRFYLPRFALNEHYGSAEFFVPRISARALPVRDVTPAVPLAPVQGAGNPPAVGFTVTDPQLSLARLTCYGPSGEALTTRQSPQSNGTRIELVLNKPLTKGRSRLNCTLPIPGPNGKGPRWYWWGTQIVVPGAWD